MNFLELLDAVGNTLLVIVLCVLIAVPLGTTIAIFAWRTNLRGRRLLWVAVTSQLALPLYVFAGGWSAAFGMQGWVTALGFRFPAGLEFMNSAAWQSQTGAMLAVAIIHALAAVPWVALFVSLGLMTLDRSQEEQALLDGGVASVILRLVLPKLRFWLALAVAWCVVSILTEIAISNLYRVSTVAELVYLDASRGTINSLTYVSSALLCMLPIVVGGILFVRLAPSWRALTSRPTAFAVRPMPLGKMRGPASAVAWAVVSLLVVLPMVSLIAKAGWFPVVNADGLATYGWSAGRFATTCYESLTLFSQEFTWSGIVAVVATSVAAGIALGVFAITAESSAAPGRRNWVRKTLRWGFSGLALVAIATPGPLVGMWVIFALNRSTPALLGQLYDTTILAPVLAQQFRLLPIAWLLVHALAASISTGTWEQARQDQLGWIDLFRRVLWPQIGKRALACVLLLMVISVGELSCSMLVLPPGVTTVSMRLFEMLHFGMRHQDSGLCGVLVLLGWVVSLAFWKTRTER